LLVLISFKIKNNNQLRENTHFTRPCQADFALYTPLFAEPEGDPKTCYWRLPFQTLHGDLFIFLYRHLYLQTLKFRGERNRVRWRVLLALFYPV
jgi:hypothetical protein